MGLTITGLIIGVLVFGLSCFRIGWELGIWVHRKAGDNMQQIRDLTVDEIAKMLLKGERISICNGVRGIEIRIDNQNTDRHYVSCSIDTPTYFLANVLGETRV